MKKILVICLAILVVLSCQKQEPDEGKPQEVVFSALQVDPGAGLKSVASDTIPCLDLEADYAKITIDGKDYFPAVFRLDGKLYTQAIKLDPGTHTVSLFVLYDDNNTPGNTADDIIIMATPGLGSEFDRYVSKPVPFEFGVASFTKAEIEVEVLCFLEKYYMEFGFDWFSIGEIIVREQCFFGDFCVKNTEEYIGSLYENQSTGLMIDMPAIFKIRAYKNNVEIPGPPFGNASAEYGWGVGHVVCVDYPDNLNVDDEIFRFELWIYVKIGDGFGYSHFHTWTFTDEEMIEDGDDGVVDFVLGSCNFSETDLLLPPYQNLPSTASLTLDYPASPGYWDVYVNSSVPSGTFDLPQQVTMPGWSGDYNHQMGPGTHNVNVYSSLNATGWPAGIPIIQEQAAMVNWLFNNLDSYDMDMEGLTDSEGDVIQDAMWKLLSGIPATGLALQMANDAAQHGGFVPLPGQMAAVIFMKAGLPLSFQMSLTIIQP